MIPVLKAQAGNRLIATFTITTEGERFGSRLTSHFSDAKQVQQKLEQLREENPFASVQVTVQ